MADSAHELTAAADRLTELAARTTPGEWRTQGLLASRPEVVAQLPGGGTEHVAEARARTAEWICASSPQLAGPLAAWLRAAAQQAAAAGGHPDPHALAVARVLLGRSAGEPAAPTRAEALLALYVAFNARDIEAVLARFAPDVDWPDAWQGGRVVGAGAVREYWLGQWEVVDLQVEPRRVRELPDGRVEVLVDQRVRDRDGDLLSHASVLHTYTFAGLLVTRMDVGDPEA